MRFEDHMQRKLYEWYYHPFKEGGATGEYESKSYGLHFYRLEFAYIYKHDYLLNTRI